MTSAHTTTTAHQGEKEANMAAHTTTITAKSATGNGDLDGFTVECTCGERASFSILGMTQKHAADHIAYMAKVGR